MLPGLRVNRLSRGPGDRVLEVVGTSSVRDLDHHLARKTHQLTRAESGTTVIVSCGAPRVMVPLC
jgi:hypothetical protein